VTDSEDAIDRDPESALAERTSRERAAPEWRVRDLRASILGPQPPRLIGFDARTPARLP